MTKEQYISFRQTNDFLSIAFESYKERLKEKGIQTGMGKDLFSTTFSIWPFNQQAINDVIAYYDAQFSVTTIDKDGKTIKIS